MDNLDHSKNIKLDKFTGARYKQWANQMKYGLTTLELISVTDDTIPISSSKTPLMASLIAPIEISIRAHSPTRTFAPLTHTSMKL